MKDRTTSIVIPVVISTVISVAGFICNYYYFTPESEERSYKKTLNNQLLTEVSNAQIAIEWTNDSIASFFATEYGVTGKQIDSIYARYYQKIQHIKALNSKIKSFGSNEQIHASDRYLGCLWKVMVLLYEHKNALHQFERSAETLQVSRKKRTGLNKLLSGYDTVIKNENELYFRLRDIVFLKIKCLAGMNNYYYRKELGMDLTTDITHSEISLIKLDSVEHVFNYKPHTYEYNVARTRSFIHYTVDGGDQTLNDVLRLRLISRYVY